MQNVIARWRRERGAIRELSRLSDRELADLGVARGDIGAAVAGTSTVRPVAALRVEERADAMAPSRAVHDRRSLAA